MTSTIEGTPEHVESGAEQELDQLMVRYRQGDSLAATELIRRVTPLLSRFFFASGVPQADVDDMLQQCWLKIHRSRHTYRAGESSLPWVFAIARHTKLDGYRKRRRIESREVLVESYPETIHPMQPGGGMASDEVSGLLAALPEAQREVILLMKVAGMSVEEVARATSSTAGAVKQKAHRAYAKLRVLLDEKNRNAQNKPKLVR